MLVQFEHKNTSGMVYILITHNSTIQCRIDHVNMSQMGFMHADALLNPKPPTKSPT